MPEEGGGGGGVIAIGDGGGGTQELVCLVITGRQTGAGLKVARRRPTLDSPLIQEVAQGLMAVSAQFSTRVAAEMDMMMVVVVIMVVIMMIMNITVMVVIMMIAKASDRGQKPRQTG